MSDTSAASSDAGTDSSASSLRAPTTSAAPLPPPDYLVRDFGYDSTSARYHGDHSAENNPDHDIDYDTPEAREIAMANARRSHAIFLGVDVDQLGRKKSAKTKDRWMRFLPRRWSRQ